MINSEADILDEPLPFDDDHDHGDKKEIYTYEAPWLIYGMNWSVRPDKPYRLAIGSFVEEYNNKVEVVQLNEESGSFESRGTFDHPYPTTKIAFMPDKTGSKEDLLATTGDYLRLWRIGEDGGIKMKSLLNNVTFVLRDHILLHHCCLLMIITITLSTFRRTRTASFARR